MPQECYQAVFPEANRCEIRPFTLPPPVADQVLVRIEASLISPGTETVIFTGQHSVLQRQDGWISFPFLPGYSAAGRVLAAGPAAQGFAVGDRVFLPAPHATHAVLASDKLLPIPNDLSFELATFAELGAIALNGVRMARVGLDDAVIVAGLGLIGLLTTRLASLSGAMPLLATDLAAPRRALGKKFGADAVLDPTTDNVLAALRHTTAGRLADVVIEATGVPRVLLESATWARRLGRVLMLGALHGEIAVNFYDTFFARNLQLIGAHVGAANHPSIDAAPWSAQRNRAVFLARAGRGDIDLESLVTRRILPEGMEAAYRSIVGSPAAHLGTVVDWTKTGGDRS